MADSLNVTAMQERRPEFKSSEVMYIQIQCRHKISKHFKYTKMGNLVELDN